MFTDTTSSLVRVLFAALFSVVIAYTFGNTGYEAFITVSIALGLLVTWQLYNLARLLFRSNARLIIQLIGSVALIFFWCIAIVGVMLSTSKNAHDPRVDTPAINWLIVLIGTIPFLVPRTGMYTISAGVQKTVLGLFVSLYSIVVLYVAALGFYTTQAHYKGFVLVIAIQLQYVMSYLVTKTNYLHQSHTLATGLVKRLGISSTSDRALYILLCIVGLPFIVPLAIVLLLSAI